MAVELQLGLSLPISIKGPLIDLNTFNSYSEELESYASIMKKNGKRIFDEASEFDSDSPQRTLPLFLWNKKPNDDDDLPNDRKTCNLALIENGEETEGIVGWPPIKTYRKKQRGQDQPTRNIGRGRGSNCPFVKAQIEGVVITRKVDLSVHRCYESLTSTLIYMFGRGHESVEEYTLTYQNKRGDWLLVAHVPWRTFVESVQRLKLMRKED